MSTLGKNPVMIVPNKKTSAIVSPYDNNPEFGYVQLEQSQMIVQGGWLRQVKRACLLRADVAILQQWVSMNKSLQLPGRIAVWEFAESELPNDVKAKYISNKMDYEDAIEQYIKRAGNDGDELATEDGERILRFAFYDETGKVEDILVQHAVERKGGSVQLVEATKPEEVVQTEPADATELPF
jgi:hypothetical protein